jgi:abhydrolase domain-containing protein 5
VYLHEIRCGFTNKSHIVLLHGFGATSLTFIRLFKKLSTRYFVHALDLLGVGLSSRVELKKDATAQ